MFVFDTRQNVNTPSLRFATQSLHRETTLVYIQYEQRERERVPGIWISTTMTYFSDVYCSFYTVYIVCRLSLTFRLVNTIMTSTK